MNRAVHKRLLTLRKRLCNGRIFSSLEVPLSSGRVIPVSRCSPRNRSRTAPPRAQISAPPGLPGRYDPALPAAPSNWITALPTGLPCPVQASQPGPAANAPLLPCVMSWKASAAPRPRTASDSRTPPPPHSVDSQGQSAPPTTAPPRSSPRSPSTAHPPAPRSPWKGPHPRQHPARRALRPSSPAPARWSSAATSAAGTACSHRRRSRLRCWPAHSTPPRW